MTDPTTERQVDEVVDGATQNAIYDFLYRSAWTNALLSEISQRGYSVTFRWSASVDRHHSGEIWIDRSRGIDAIPSAVASHEITHAHAYFTGTDAQAATMTRGQYVRTAVAEEINAGATSYLVHWQSGSTLVPPSGYDEFRDHMERHHPNEWRNQNNPAAVAHRAQTFVELRVSSGTIAPANTGLDYKTYYGNSYDRFWQQFGVASAANPVSLTAAARTVRPVSADGIPRQPKPPAPQAAKAGQSPTL